MHLWLRSELRPEEGRTPLLPGGVAALRAAGFRVTVEEAPNRVFPTRAYAEAGGDIVPAFSWPAAPRDAIILGLRNLPCADFPLIHTHIMFGLALKGQASGRALLARLRAGGGTLLDLDHLCGATGQRLIAFGHWAGFTGAAVALLGWSAQMQRIACPPLTARSGQDVLLQEVRTALRAAPAPLPEVLILGAHGRCGSGAAAFCAALGLRVQAWDRAETASGGPFPALLGAPVLLNCVMVDKATPVFLPDAAVSGPRALRVIGDIACDYDSRFNAIRIADRPTSWAAPLRRVHEAPPLDVMSIDNLPALLPFESSEDFAEQLLPALLLLPTDDRGPWAALRRLFQQQAAAA